MSPTKPTCTRTLRAGTAFARPYKDSLRPENRMRQKTLKTLSACALTLAASAVVAATQTTGTIGSAAEAAVRASLGPLPKTTRVSADPIDPRLRLAACSRSLDSTVTTPVTTQARRTTVRVSCAGTTPWKLYVPVRIEQQIEVAVAKRTLAPGTSIAASDLRTEWRNLAELPPDVLIRPEALHGLELRQVLTEGQVVRGMQVRAPNLLQRGQKVVIVASGGGINVKMNGVAESTGRRGAIVTVRNERSGRRIQARVLDRAHVEALGSGR